MSKTKKDLHNPRYLAINFLKNLDPIQRDKLKNMLDKDINCCRGLANAYNMCPDEFQSELKDLLAVGGN